MAQKIEVLLIDDLDGTSADETVTFACDGSRYEIDLSASNATHLRQALQPFVKNARKSKSASPRSSRATSHRERSADIRTWAKKRGIEINERGRIPASVIEQYDAAH
jgi:nucleoid-associated protein Lsr2